jgi:hypothetical protein
MLMRVMGGRVRNVLRQNFDALLAHVRATALS